jgi:diguanylate cyclase (GGDEF)-like protein/PAS domain S-box-containing protein
MIYLHWAIDFHEVQWNKSGHRGFVIHNVPWIVRKETSMPPLQSSADQMVVSDLYAELMRSRDEFHRLTIKHEESIKNLAKMNEELRSINEELRCATEELEEHRALLEAGNVSLNEMVNRVTRANNDLENFVDSSELAVVFVDSHLRIVRYTPSAALLFNFIPRDVGRPLLDISHHLDYQMMDNDIRGALDYHERVEREIRNDKGDWFSVRIVPYHSNANVTDGVVLTFVDITLRKQAEEQLHLGEQRWKLAVEASGDGIWDWDVATNKSFLSPSWRQIIGYDLDEFPGETLEEWEALVHPDDRQKVLQDIRACANRGPGWYSHEYRIRCNDGHWKWVLSRGAVVERDQAGQATRIIGTLSDISQKKMLEHQIWYRANFDVLTGLPNRNFFLDRLDYEVKHSERANQPFALLFIDLDRFKEVNDLHGHSAGDLLLKVVADELKTCIRESDTVARLGGDEFTVVLTGTRDTTHVELIAEDILNKLAQPIDLAGNIVHISGSIGITFFPKDANTAADLVRNADQAMYVAKNAGRNRCRFFSQAMQDAALNRISIMNDLHDATQGQLALCFQPIVDMHSGTIVKAEALLRWRHPTRGLILPDQFIHLAEEAGLIGPIGDWVFKEAANSALQISNILGRPFQISINKSPLELSSSNGLPNVDLITYLDNIGLDNQNIVIEITEGVLLHATPQVKERIASLREAGIQFALDDFGTGYSSMSYLTRYHVDFLKIDQSFVKHRTPDVESSAIAEAMIVLAHKLGLKVIAEGVERQDQHDWLSTAGCDYSQGFLYSHPVELPTLEALVQKSVANHV